MRTIGAVRSRAVARLLRGVLVPFGVTRLLLACVGAFSIALIPLSPWAPLDFVHRGISPFVDAFARWDAQRYVGIAMDGYTTADPVSHAFFPLFPTLIATGAAVTGQTDVPGHELVGVVIANVALVAAVMGLIALVRLDHDRATATRAAWYVMVFPTTLFLSAAYAESLFLALSVGAVLAARTRRWAIAGVLAGLATLTRPFGILILVPLAVEAWLQRHDGRVWQPLVALLVPFAALGAFAGYLAVHVGDPLAFVHAQAGWDRGLMPPWETLALFLSQPLTIHSGLHSSVDLAFTIGLALVALASWRLLRPSYAAFLSALLLAALSTGALLSIGRFSVGWFPVFMVLAVVGRRPVVDRVLLVTGAGVAAVFMVLYAQWYWVS
jgi:hypothetical protein